MIVSGEYFHEYLHLQHDCSLKSLIKETTNNGLKTSFQTNSQSFFFFTYQINCLSLSCSLLRLLLGCCEVVFFLRHHYFYCKLCVDVTVILLNKLKLNSIQVSLLMKSLLPFLNVIETRKGFIARRNRLLFTLFEIMVISFEQSSFIFYV